MVRLALEAGISIFSRDGSAYGGRGTQSLNDAARLSRWEVAQEGI
jgi:hypothetical protein